MLVAPDLTKHQIANPEIARLIESRQGALAVEAAHLRLAEARRSLTSPGAGDATRIAAEVAEGLSDLACALLSCGETAAAANALLEAAGVAPKSQAPFHNLVALLLGRGQLRGENLQSIIARLDELRDVADWAAQYRSLAWMPTFLNLEFVKGKCNLKCRMCIGTNAPGHPGRLSYMTADDFRRALVAAPTIGGITLSSGDSDPLLHPQFEKIIDIAQERGVHLDLFTNGLPLGERMCRRFVESQAIGMVNFSIDAATAETYQRIRGGDFERLQRNMQMLCRMKTERGCERPFISLSFVAMADNIEELPAFVELGRTYGARRIFVEDLLGWMTDAGGNHPAIENPRCHESVCEAQRLAQEAGIFLQVPERLLNASPSEPREVPSSDAPVGAIDMSAADQPMDVDSSTAPAASTLRCCSWINGAWVSGNGDLQPCCMVHGVADMGNTADGPLYRNDKYDRVKTLLAEGKVFRKCASQTMCAFVQQEKVQGRELRFIASEELSELDLSTAREARVSLPVLSAS